MKSFAPNAQQAWTAFDGEPLREGEILTPQIVDPEYARMIGTKDVRTWTMCGVRYHVMFVAVPLDQAEIALKTYYAELNELLDEKLGPNRYSRCLITLPDGSRERCPKVKNGKVNRCTGCPLRGKLEKEDRSTVSLDALDEEEYAPMENAPSAEEVAGLGLLLEDLLTELEKASPRSAEIVRLGWEGLEKKEIVEMLSLCKSQAYEAYRKARKDVEAFLRG